MLPDLLAPDLRLVICGSAVGAASAMAGHYYAGPGNKFWRTLAEVGLTDRELSPAEYRELLSFGIGLTDLVKTQSGSDSRILFGDPDREGLRARIEHFQPRYLCFNGKRAAREYLDRKDVACGVRPNTIGRTALFVAPSTSGAANRSWDISVWRELAERVGGDTGQLDPPAGAPRGEA